MIFHTCYWHAATLYNWEGGMQRFRYTYADTCTCLVLTRYICQTDIMTTWWQIRQHSPRWETPQVAIFFIMNAVSEDSCHAIHDTDRIAIQCFQTRMIHHMCFTEQAEPDPTTSTHWNPYSCMRITQEKNLPLIMEKDAAFFSQVIVWDAGSVTSNNVPWYTSALPLLPENNTYPKNKP